MKTELLLVSLVTVLLFPLGGVAQDSHSNYVVSLQLLTPKNDEILSSSLVLSDPGSYQEIDRKTYAITECAEASEKKIRDLQGKTFLTGFKYSVDPKKGVVEFTEYTIDDSKYKSYDKNQCFKAEVKQIVHTSTHKVTIGSEESQQFVLPSSNTLILAIHKEDRL